MYKHASFESYPAFFAADRSKAFVWFDDEWHDFNVAEVCCLGGVLTERGFFRRFGEVPRLSRLPELPVMAFTGGRNG
jgi:hypothetical protein